MIQTSSAAAISFRNTDFRRSVFLFAEKCGCAFMDNVLIITYRKREKSFYEF